MKLTRFCALAIACGALNFTGCDDKKVADVKNQIADYAKMAPEKFKEAKEGFVKSMSDKFGGIEEKIKGLTGEKKTEAEGLFGQLKDKVNGLADTAPDKFGDAKKAIDELYEKIKTMLGM
jgi:hypothetical protein